MQTNAKIASIDAKIGALIECEERAIVQRQFLENNITILAGALNRLLAASNLETVKFSHRKEDGSIIETDDPMVALTGMTEEERAKELAKRKADAAAGKEEEK